MRKGNRKEEKMEGYQWPFISFEGTVKLEGKWQTKGRLSQIVTVTSRL